MDAYAPDHTETRVRIQVSSAASDFYVYVGDFPDKTAAEAFIKELSLRLAMSRGVVDVDEVTKHMEEVKRSGKARCTN